MLPYALLALGLAVALTWPWLPSSYRESVVLITALACIIGANMVPLVFMHHHDVAGFFLLALFTLFLLGYPLWYFPVVYARRRHKHH